jgi:hypothetical protein
MDIDTCESQYIDVMWLKTFGLSRHTILEYFYTSPFYDSKSNNQIIRTQGNAIIVYIKCDLSDDIFLYRHFN